MFNKYLVSVPMLKVVFLGVYIHATHCQPTPPTKRYTRYTCVNNPKHEKVSTGLPAGLRVGLYCSSTGIIVICIPGIFVSLVNIVTAVRCHFIL